MLLLMLSFQEVDLRIARKKVSYILCLLTNPYSNTIHSKFFNLSTLNLLLPFMFSGNRKLYCWRCQCQLKRHLETSININFLLPLWYYSSLFNYCTTEGQFCAVFLNIV